MFGVPGSITAPVTVAAQSVQSDPHNLRATDLRATDQNASSASSLQKASAKKNPLDIKKKLTLDKPVPSVLAQRITVTDGLVPRACYEVLAGML